MNQRPARKATPTELTVEQPTIRLSPKQADVLRDFHAPRTIGSLAGTVHERHRLWTLIRNLVRRRLLERTDAGLYQLTAHGREALNPTRRVLNLEMPGAPLPDLLAETVLDSAPTFKAAALAAGLTTAQLAPRLGDQDTFVCGDAACVALRIQKTSNLFSRARNGGIPVAQRHLPLAWLEREAQARQAPAPGELNIAVLAREAGLSPQEGARRAKMAGLKVFFRLTDASVRSLHVTEADAERLRPLLARRTQERSTSAADLEAHLRQAGEQGLLLSQLIPKTDLSRETITVHLDRMVTQGRLTRHGEGVGIPATYRHADFSHLPAPALRRRNGKAVVPRAHVEAAVRAGGPLGVTITDLRAAVDVSTFGLYTHMRALVDAGCVQEFGGKKRTETMVWRHVAFAHHPTDGLRRRPNAQQQKTQADKDRMVAALHAAGRQGLTFEALIAPTPARATPLMLLLKELLTDGLVDHYPSGSRGVASRYRHPEFRHAAPPTMKAVPKDMSSVVNAAIDQRKIMNALIHTALRYAGPGGLNAPELRARLDAPRAPFWDALRAAVKAGTISRTTRNRDVWYATRDDSAPTDVPADTVTAVLACERLLLDAGQGGMPLRALYETLGDEDAAQALLTFLEQTGHVRVWKRQLGNRYRRWVRHAAFHTHDPAPVWVAYYLDLAQRRLRRAGPAGIDARALVRALEVQAVTPEAFLGALERQPWANISPARPGRARHVTYVPPATRPAQPLHAEPGDVIHSEAAD